jgi:hypothetical protein
MCGARDHAAMLLAYQHALRADELVGVKLADEIAVGAGLPKQKAVAHMLRLSSRALAA